MEFIIELVLKYPTLGSIVVVMGTLRLILKPLVSAVQTYVASTASTRDDEIVEGVLSSKYYKAFAFILDYAASVKLPKK